MRERRRLGHATARGVTTEIIQRRGDDRVERIGGRYVIYAGELDQESRHEDAGTRPAPSEQ